MNLWKQAFKEIDTALNEGKALTHIRVSIIRYVDIKAEKLDSVSLKS
jgi:hypothetical protein